MRICTIAGCSRRAHDFGTMCSNHYYRKAKYGDALARTRQDPNRFWTEGKFGFIELYDSRNEPKAVAIIDIEDLPLVSDKKWCLTSAGYVQSTARNRGKPFTLHRLLMGFPVSGIDHKDGDPLNNRRSNLRLADSYANNRNRRSSGTYKGVYRSGSGWIVRVWLQGNNVNVGTFKDPVEAAHIYNEVAKQLLGRRARFLRLNRI